VVSIPRTCTICSHPARETIDSALIRRTPYRNIAQRFSVSETALSRHLNDHLAEYVQQALSHYGLQKGVKVLARLSGVIEKLEAYLENAEDSKEFVVVAAEFRKELELIAKLQGELAQEGTTTIITNPEYVEVRTLIVQALEPYPDAREAVVRALGAGGNGSG